MVTSLPDAQVYAKQLLLKRHGYPLWVPEPYGNSVAYRTKGVRIGDVGYVTPDGAFETLFNLRAAAADPINFRGVPEGFEQVVVPEEDIVHIPNYHQSNSTVTSASAKKRNLNVELATPDLSTGGAGAGASAQFTWNSSEGAILHLPDGASRLTSPAEVFRNAALRGAKNWYKFANVALHRGVPNGALYLVTGCDKCRSWMVGSFADTSSDCQASLKLDAAYFGAAGASYSYAWETSSPAVYRTGPHASVDSYDVLSRHGASIVRDDEVFYLDAPSGQNQCVFLRGYRIMLRMNPVSSMLGISTKIDMDSILNTNPKDIFQTSMKGPYTHSGCWPISHNDSPQSGGAKIMNSIDFPGDEVTLEHHPDVSHPYHPSDAINNFLLSNVPHATVAVTHDDDWCSVIHDGEPSLPNEDVLISRISNQFAIMNTDASAFLCLKGPNHKPSVSVENACDSCLTLPLETLDHPISNELHTFPSRDPRCIPPSSKTGQSRRVLAQYSPMTLQAKDTKRKDSSGTSSVGSGQSSRTSYLSDVSNSSPRTFVENREGHIMERTLQTSLIRDRRGVSEMTESAENTLTCPPSLPRKRLKPNGRPNTAPAPSTCSEQEIFKVIRRQRSFDMTHFPLPHDEVNNIGLEFFYPT